MLLFDQLPLGDRLQPPSQETSSNRPRGPLNVKHLKLKPMARFRHVKQAADSVATPGALAPHGRRVTPTRRLTTPFAKVKKTSLREVQGRAIRAPRPACRSVVPLASDPPPHAAGLRPGVCPCF